MNRQSVFVFLLIFYSGYISGHRLSNQRRRQLRLMKTTLRLTLGQPLAIAFSFIGVGYGIAAITAVWPVAVPVREGTESAPGPDLS